MYLLSDLYKLYGGMPLQVDRSKVSQLWDGLRKCDREASGKVTACELGAALGQAGIKVSKRRRRMMMIL